MAGCRCCGLRGGVAPGGVGADGCKSDGSVQVVCVSGRLGLSLKNSKREKQKSLQKEQRRIMQM